MENQLILVINAGSSSLKFGLFNANSMQLCCEGLAEALNSPSASISITHFEETQTTSKEQIDSANHADAINRIIDQLDPRYGLSSHLSGIGHRVVHGGETFQASSVIDTQVVDQIRTCIPLAPLHNPANLQGIELMQQKFPDTHQVAVFDTAFHQSMPQHAYLYALPYELYRAHGVRRYGFHGSSHRFVSQRSARLVNKPMSQLNIISAHLGNGASICAVKEGNSVDTSMGLTPLEGLVMGTRSGDIDPGIFDFLIAKGYTAAEISRILNKQSGLLGISESSNDMRTLEANAAEGHSQSELAIEVFCFRLAKYIAAMMVSLNTLDALVFTGGIGENSASVRQRTVAHLTLLGFRLDPQANATVDKAAGSLISHPDSHPVYVIATDEERMIAEDTYEITRAIG